MKQKTFLMLKPDAFAGGHAQEVLRELRSHGLVIEKSSARIYGFRWSIRSAAAG